MIDSAKPVKRPDSGIINRIEFVLYAVSSKVEVGAHLVNINS